MSEKQKLDHLIQVSKIDLETLLQLSSSTVYCLCNDSEKRVQVYGSKTTLVHLGHVLEEINVSGEYKELKKDISKVKLVVLETNVDPSTIRLKISNWIREYKARGYTMYKDIAPLRYTLETVLEYKSGRLCYCLYLANRRSDKKLIGIFDKKKDLVQWTKVHYVGNVVSEIVVHESVIGNSTSNR